MDLNLSPYFSEALREYKSPSQIARNVTEKWAKDNLYCPKCGSQLKQHRNNTEVYDFFCDHSNQEFILFPAPLEEFQLKSTKSFPYNGFPKKIVGSGYDAAQRRLDSGMFPSLILLHYQRKAEEVRDGLLIHRLSIPPSSIRPRKPLSNNARREGWRGYEIIMQRIPYMGGIPFIEEGKVTEKETVLAKWKYVENIMEGTPSERSWRSEITLIVDKLPSSFTLQDVYSQESNLRNLYPNNFHIRDKIRQQLQVLRDKGFIKFVGNGRYQKHA